MTVHQCLLQQFSLQEGKATALLELLSPCFILILVGLSIFQDLDKMELASHTSLDVSSRFAAMPVVVQTGILRDSPGRGAVNAQDLRWHSSE